MKIAVVTGIASNCGDAPSALATIQAGYLISRALEELKPGIADLIPIFTDQESQNVAAALLARDAMGGLNNLLTLPGNTRQSGTSHAHIPPYLYEMIEAMYRAAPEPDQARAMVFLTSHEAALQMMSHWSILEPQDKPSDKTATLCILDTCGEYKFIPAVYNGR